MGQRRVQRRRARPPWRAPSRGPCSAPSSAAGCRTCRRCSRSRRCSPSWCRSSSRATPSANRGFPIPAAPPCDWVLMVASGLLGVGIGQSLFYRAVPVIGVATSTSIGLLIPLLAAVVSWLAFGERLSAHPDRGRVPARARKLVRHPPAPQRAEVSGTARPRHFPKTPARWYRGRHGYSGPAAPARRGPGPLGLRGGAARDRERAPRRVRGRPPRRRARQRHRAEARRGRRAAALPHARRPHGRDRPDRLGHREGLPARHPHRRLRPPRALRPAGHGARPARAPRHGGERAAALHRPRRAREARADRASCSSTWACRPTRSSATCASAT